MSTREPKLFTGLIYCKYCRKKMRFQKQRNKNFYICNTYSTKGECKRNPISEQVLVDLISSHCDIHNKELILEHQFLKEEISKIIISEDEILIEFKNLPNIINNHNTLSFIE